MSVDRGEASVDTLSRATLRQHRNWRQVVTPLEYGHEALTAVASFPTL